MLSQVHIVCFAASYFVALALEISRLFLRVPVRTIVGIGFTAAGLLAHAIYLVMRSSRDPAATPRCLVGTTGFFLLLGGWLPCIW
jgi:hypothetical protein